MKRSAAIVLLRLMDAPTVTPALAAKVLECDPQKLRVEARNGTLQIPHIMSGNRLKISTAGLLDFIK